MSQGTITQILTSSVPRHATARRISDEARRIPRNDWWRVIGLIWPRRPRCLAVWIPRRVMNERRRFAVVSIPPAGYCGAHCHTTNCDFIP